MFNIKECKKGRTEEPKINEMEKKVNNKKSDPNITISIVTLNEKLCMSYFGRTGDEQRIFNQQVSKFNLGWIWEDGSQE